MINSVFLSNFDKKMWSGISVNVDKIWTILNESLKWINEEHMWNTIVYIKIDSITTAVGPFS